MAGTKPVCPHCEQELDQVKINDTVLKVFDPTKAGMLCPQPEARVYHCPHTNCGKVLGIEKVERNRY